MSGECGTRWNCIVPRLSEPANNHSTAGAPPVVVATPPTQCWSKEFGQTISQRLLCVRVGHLSVVSVVRRLIAVCRAPPLPRLREPTLRVAAHARSRCSDATADSDSAVRIVYQARWLLCHGCARAEAGAAGSLSTLIAAALRPSYFKVRWPPVERTASVAAPRRAPRPE